VTEFPQRIVVGYDGSESARQALERVVDVAGDGASVVLVTAAESLYSEPWSRQVDPHEVVRRDGTLSSGREFLAERGIAATTVPAIGDPAEAILAAAREAKADLIVVGRRGQSLVARLALGSVSTKVVQQSEQAVLVAR